MKSSKTKVLFIALLIISFFIHLFSLNSQWVEDYYSSGFYPVFSKILRYLFGWIPFSVGDLFYGILALWIVFKIFWNIKKMVQQKNEIRKIVAAKCASFLLLIYIIFNLFWGLNYDRKGIAYQLDLSDEKYTQQELREMDSILLTKVNECKKNSLLQKDSTLNNKEILAGSLDAYSQLSKTYSFIQYQAPSVKPSLWGWVGNYLNFTGYYNPFSAEAQVNTTVPSFLQPYTTCHEMAHQIGYAKENEANFVGYLAASTSTNFQFNYSVYLDLFLYTNRNLSLIDSVTAKNNIQQLLPEVKADLKTWKTFVLNYQSPLEPAIKWLYGKYLQGNKQPSGMMSYDEVTGLLIAYYRKYKQI